MSNADHARATGAAAVDAAINRAVRAIPPLWPLASSVAVNPFLGQAGESLADASARLGRVAGAPLTMPRGWYQKEIASGVITDADLCDALAAAPQTSGPQSLAALKYAAQRPPPAPRAAPTIPELAGHASQTDWTGFIADRFGAWAAGFFDDGQALWAAPVGRSAYGAWRAVATHDLTPEIMGLSGFAAHVAGAPERAAEVIAGGVDALAIPEAALETYFHQTLMTLGGWAQFARRRLWEAELAGGSDDTARDFLAIRLLWDTALYRQHQAKISAPWRAALDLHASPVKPTEQQVIDSILQAASERAGQRQLAATLAAPSPPRGLGRPALQAVFCIDVRSEVFRRALESLSPEIQTLGFAGFFGIGTSHHRFASDTPEHRLPVLLNPAAFSRSGRQAEAAADQAMRIKARAKRAWGRFKLAAVSSFAFVEAAGPIYAEKLLVDALGVKAPSAAAEPQPRFEPELAPAARLKAAETVLRAMSLTSGFARLVLFTGHGAHLVNNPHASALQCGACGGYSGEVNARLLAGLLNDPEVRDGLGFRGIDIPKDTLFMAALHDTTSDKVTLYADDQPCEVHQPDILKARAWLNAAGVRARAERAWSLPRARGAKSLEQRGCNWAETRPEWGLAGCQAFIAAPRSRTAGKSLRGRAFLHDYDWTKDKGFAVLELILTAPVVVASWISLQYYGSTVAPEVFGSGNKLLHNVAGGVGVLEGNGGLMRSGLPWQSVHDGDRYVHQPHRLSVVIEAPLDAITRVLETHDAVRTLFDNAWLHLFALDEAGRMAWRYAGAGRWSAEDLASRPPD